MLLSVLVKQPAVRYKNGLISFYTEHFLYFICGCQLKGIGDRRCSSLRMYWVPFDRGRVITTQRVQSQPLLLYKIRSHVLVGDKRNTCIVYNSAKSFVFKVFAYHALIFLEFGTVRVKAKP